MNYTRKQFFHLAGASLLVASGCGDDTGGAGGGSTGSGGSGSGGGGATGTGGSGDGGGATTGSGSTSSTGSGSTSSSGGSTSSSSTTSGASTSTGAVTCSAAIVAAISGNHGHALEIPLADIEAGVEKMYSAQGTSGHCHQVTLTADDFATLQAGGTVRKLSCNGGDHEYVLSCAADPPAPQAPDCSADPQFGSC